MHYTPSQILKKIGCSPKETQIYIECLTYGGLTVTGLHRKTQLPRATLYDTLQKLELKGFISKAKRNNTLTFYAVSVQELMVLMEDQVQSRNRKKQILSTHIECFQQLMHVSDNIPDVKMYQGKEALSIIYEQVKHSNHIRTIYNPEITNQYLSKEFTKEMHILHHETKTEKKVLLTPSRVSEKEKTSLEEMSFHAKILPDSFPIYTDTIITDHKLLFVSYGKQIHAIEITQPLFISTQRSMFDIVWESL